MTENRAEQGRYREEAYVFLMEALDRCRRELKREGHVSGSELLRAVQAQARERFGPLAAMVFKEWGIQGGGDFGHIVYDLIDRGVLFEREEDSLQEFMGGRTYEEIFEAAYFESSTGGEDRN